MLRKMITMLAVLACGGAWAQGADPRTEPSFPPVCKTIAAPLRADAAGFPVTGDEDAESERQRRLVQGALNVCPKRQAVRLSLGSNHDRFAFLINPIVLPPAVSLIIDGGVTVFASRNPANYQLQARDQPEDGPAATCGEVGPNWPIYGCYPLVALNAGSGVYGYGVIDGQGQRPMIGKGRYAGRPWWHLLRVKQIGCRPDGVGINPKNGCEQAAPHMILGSSQNGYRIAHDQSEEMTNLTVYKVTVRNPPFHTIRLAARGLTASGVKVQAPWNVANSDGFDISGSNILLQDITVANGDQDVAISADGQAATSGMRIEKATFYGKGGVALLGSGTAITDLHVRDLAMTGDVTSFERLGTRPDGRPDVRINGRDPLAVLLRNQKERMRDFRNALPTSINLTAMQISYETGGAVYEKVRFDTVCLRDVDRPISISGQSSGETSDPGPVDGSLVRSVAFRDVHALAPTEQFPSSAENYRLLLSSPAASSPNRILLGNVVIEGIQTANIEASDNIIRTVENIYPRALNALAGNSYPVKTDTFDRDLAIPCPASLWPFLTAELYPSSATGVPLQDGSSSQALTIRAGQDVTLNAVVQPAMSQSDWYQPDDIGVKPGTLAIGAPALTGPIEFREGEEKVGVAGLGANGTLASVIVPKIAKGRHVYTARYRGDAHYRLLSFGRVVVQAQ